MYTCTAVVPASGLAQVSGDPRRPNEINKYKPARAEDATGGFMLLLGMGLGFAGFLFKACTIKSKCFVQSLCHFADECDCLCCLTQPVTLENP